MIGEWIANRRQELGMTQEELAKQVFVSVQAVSQWENGRTMPDVNNYPRIADALQIPISELFDDLEKKPNWVIRDQMFSDSHMYTRLKTIAQMEHLEQTYHALSYAQKMHDGVLRKPNKFNRNAKVPYIFHPLMMACHAHAIGIRDDKVLAVCMLHDVCEDCGVLPKELPFPEEIQHAVALLTKKKGQKTKEYYDGIASNSVASIVKALDRCNNVSTMAASFSREKLIAYVDETEKYVYPLLNHIKEHDLEYNDQVFVIKYHLMSLIETIKAMIID